MRRVLAQLAFVLALVVAWLLPRAARAALVPTCDAAELATIVAPPEQPSCTVVTRVIDEATGATQAAPICDPRGASAIAPQRVLPVEDARIDAAPSCGADELVPLVGPHAQGTPQALPAGLAEAAIVSANPPVPKATLSAILDAIEVPSRPHAGFERGIDHPPR
jgi:hypothetical protein